MSTTKIISICGWVIAIGALTFFVISDIGISETQTFTTDFQKSDRIFSDLGPPTRVVKDGKTVTAVAEPLYVDVRVPTLTDFVQARVNFVSSKENQGIEPQVGIEDRDQNVQLFPMFTIKTDSKIDLTNYKRHDGMVRFVISAPGVSKDHSMSLVNFVVETHRKSIVGLLGDEVHRLWSWMRRY